MLVILVDHELVILIFHNDIRGGTRGYIAREYIFILLNNET